ncbi:hypothetical protein H3H54_02690 [Brachybacterium sp. Z12]|uniref:hypothetical protein n=1 Tax=Brachybacterium sp. Z12 TaxID=2759167 RepID=UPI0018609DEB|nr:hypothetical protein [Brachybacterium sp. Z12]QNN82808.1 hypothetical protein H3H54_02690 [Brachybacterium sp. Z12]
MSSHAGNVVRGIFGAVVSIAIIAFGIAWATTGVSLGQSVLLGLIVAVAGVLRLADAARQVFRTVDGEDG